MLESDVLQDLSPVGSGKMRFYTSSWHHIHAILGMIEGLKHGYEGRPGISFFKHACAVVVQLYNTLLIYLRHLIHYPFKPLEWTLFPCYPIIVGSLGLESSLVLLLPVAVIMIWDSLNSYLYVLLVFFLGLHVVDDVLDYADHGSGTYPQPNQQHHLVFLVVLCWCSIWTVYQDLRKAVSQF